VTLQLGQREQFGAEGLLFLGRPLGPLAEQPTERHAAKRGQKSVSAHPNPVTRKTKVR